MYNRGVCSKKNQVDFGVYGTSANVIRTLRILKIQHNNFSAAQIVAVNIPNFHFKN